VIHAVLSRQADKNTKISIDLEIIPSYFKNFLNVASVFLLGNLYLLISAEMAMTGAGM